MGIFAKILAMNLAENINKIKALKGLPDWFYESLSNIENEVSQVVEASQSHAQELTYRAGVIAKLEFENKLLRRLRFAAKNEAFSPVIRDLLEETLESDIAAVQAEIEVENNKSGHTKPAQKNPRSRAGRQALPAHLPRVDYHHEIKDCACSACGKDLVRIGEDVSEKLDVKPAEFFVQRHIRGKYACHHCETLTSKAVPAQVIDGGMASYGLLAWLIIGKYVEHLPLYRLEDIAKRSGVPLARSTLAHWCGEIGVALAPLYDALRIMALHREVLHADETPIKQLDPGRGKSKTAYLWAYRTNDLDLGPPLIVFDYQVSRSGVHARTFLGDWQGYLLTDDYAGYKHLYKGLGPNPPKIVELGCFAHARRKFFDLHVANQSQLAAQALTQIAKFYEVESAAKEMTVENRKQYRQEHAVPALLKFKAWLDQERLKLAPKSATAKAFNYTLKRWDALIRYAYTGNLPIDNNPVENSIRPIAIGKKNWLFVGSERAGKRAAVIQSLIGTARLNDLDPQAWLKDVLEKLPTWPNSRIRELLPLKTNYPLKTI
jgi:transposase